MSLYRQILGVPEDAAIDLIKANYRSLCKKYHPDLNDEESIGKMALINEAYGVLMKGCRDQGPSAATRLPGRGSGSPGKNEVSLRKHQDYAFYKQGFLHFRRADNNLTFRDENEWNKDTRDFDRKDGLESYERNLYKALYFFNIVCTEYLESEWRSDSLEKIQLLNQKRAFLAKWKSRFEK